MGLNIVVTCEDAKDIHSDNDISLIGTFVVELDAIAKKNKFRPLLPYFLDEEAMGENDETVYLDPKDAIATLEGIAAVLKNKPGAARFLTAQNVEEILEEIPDLVALLNKAVKRKQRVRLVAV